MEYFLPYLLKASIGIALFYLFYFLVLRKETFYFSNRMYLIAGLILAVLLPVFPITYTTPVAQVVNTDFFTINESVLSKSGISIDDASVSFSIWNNPTLMFSAIYLLGAGFFLLRLVLQTGYVAIQFRHGKKMHIDGISVIDIKGKVMPFSFFNKVIINIQEYTQDELSNILAHEKVHIQEQHWVDLLIIELLTIVFWINPIVWLYERSIKQNHEYLADQGVLLAGYSPGQYQALLINQLMGVKILGFTNNLNFSLNKKRMEMMKKEKSPGASKMKLLLALPIIALLVFAFAKEEYVPIIKEVNTSINQEIPGQNKVLKAPLNISGKVLSVDNNPISSATFTSQGKILEENSNQQGEFEIVLPKGYEFTETIIDVGNNTKLKGIKFLVNLEGFEAATMLIDPEEEMNHREVLLRKKIIVKGRVIDNTGRTLVDTKIVEEGSNVETTSDREGKFEIETAQGRILMFSHHGYKTIHYALVGEKIENPTIIMKEDKKRKFKIHGWVRDENRQLLEGANIIEKNTTNGTASDEKGMYFLEVSDGSSIVISYVGYKTVEVELSHRYNQNGVPSLSPTSLERAVFNIELPDANDPNLKAQLPPPPPPLHMKNKDGTYRIVENMPYYGNGGMTMLALDIKKEVDLVLDKTKDRGEVVVCFTVAANGKIVNPYITKSANSKMLDTSAVKIIAKLDNWWAGMQRGKRVPIDLAVPVMFED